MEAIKVEVPKFLIVVCNQLYEIERRLKKVDVDTGIQRNLSKIKDALDEVKIFYEDPIGQKYNETRSDLEATISGERTEGLVVIEVIKPIIKYRLSSIDGKEFSHIVQKGVVIVENKGGI